MRLHHFSPTVANTEDIPQLRGVKQGCPLSPLLFNFAVEGMLRGVESLPVGYTLSDGQKISCLAYVDDLCVGLNQERNRSDDKLNKIEEFSRWVQLSFNPMKCASLSMINRLRKKYVEPFFAYHRWKSDPSLEVG